MKPTTLKTVVILAIAISTASLSFVIAKPGNHLRSKQQLPRVPVNPQIDYAGFQKMVGELGPLRERRRVAYDRFLEMAKDKNTIILDTRSKWAFDAMHLEGAIHLNFSDFTEQKLAKVIPNKKTRILIYCNNNFDAPRVPAIQMKMVPLALNIPTFVNLHGYGYKNVFELADVLKLDDPRLALARK